MFDIPEGTKIVIAYDINSVTRMDALKVTDDLAKYGIVAIICPVDGQASKEPFKMFEVKGEN